MNKNTERNSCRIGIYVRESRDDNGENLDTLETQKSLLLSFVEQNNMGEVHRLYVDDNVSGSSFERNGLQNLMQDVAMGNIDTLLLKDLSRLGRNNAKTLLLLEELEERGIRVMTHDGRYDSSKDNETVGIMTWLNESYVRDISRKIRANLRYKISRGEFLGHAPYGYVKSKSQKNALVMDPVKAETVKRIFRWYLDGFGYASIAQKLNREGCPPPCVKLEQDGWTQESHTGSHSIGKPQWSSTAVGRILNNGVYVGDTIQGVSEKISFKSKKTRRLPASKWIITENTHPPIISREEFQRANGIRAERKPGSLKHKGVLHTFKGMLTCGCCGAMMFARKRKDRPLGYVCGKYAIQGRSGCRSHFIREDDLQKIMVDDLMTLLTNEWTAAQLIHLSEQYLKTRIPMKDAGKSLKRQIEEKERQQVILYGDRLEGRISGELFQRMNRNLEGILLKLREEIKEAYSKGPQEGDGGKLFEDFKTHILKDGIDNDMARMLLDEIAVLDRTDLITVRSNTPGIKHRELFSSVPSGAESALIIRYKI